MGNSKILKEIDYSKFQEFNDRWSYTRFPEIVKDNYINWLNTEKQLEISIEDFFNCVPLANDLFIGLQISEKAWAGKQNYISHYLMLNHTLSGWTYVEKNCGKHIKCLKGQPYSYYQNPGTIQFYKTFKAFGKRIIKDFGLNYNVILLSQMEWSEGNYYGKI